ncbi:MAG: NRDE family protein [Pseudomonadota bacterium]
MCLIAVALHARDDLTLVLVGNRDEFHERPAAPLGWQAAGGAEYLGGRDLQAGGTWLALSRAGRLGAITNFRTGTAAEPGLASRGELVTNWVTGSDSAAAFADSLVRTADRYAPYNLLYGCAATGKLHYFSNRTATPLAVGRGVHGLSNHLLNTAWPKTTRTTRRLRQTLALPGPLQDEALFMLLADREGAPDAELPDTGVGLDFERLLAPPFIVSERYGTRCSSVVTVSLGGQCSFVERRFDAQGNVAGQHHEQFRLATAPG